MLFKSRKKNDLPKRRQNRDINVERPVIYARNQTLSSYGRTDDEESRRKRTHELNKIKRRLLWLSCFLILITSSLALLLSQFTSSVSVTSETNLKDDVMQDYQETINDYYNNNPSERFGFLLKIDKMLYFLQQQAPEIKSIKLAKKTGILTNNTTYEIQTRTPVARWAIGEKSYYVDGVGKAFTVNNHPEPSLSIVDENNLSITPGESSVASNRFLEFVGRISTDIGLQGLKISKASIPIGKTRELDISIEGLEYYFKLSIDRSPSEQAEDIKRIINHISNKNLTPRYVDIRVKGRAFYK